MVQLGEARSGYMLRRLTFEQRENTDQFQPREFSAIMGPEISCVRAELPALVPLPRLFRSKLVCSGEVRPPAMRALAPPMRAGLPDCIISGGPPNMELERRWLCLRFLYLRAMKNMAAP